MTTDRWTRGLVLLVGLAALGASCQTGRSTMRGGLPEAEVRAFPPRVQRAYHLFAVKCSRCHTLSRPLNAGIVEHDHWQSYVTRMRRQTGSGISPADAKEIMVFLAYYADLEAAQRGLRPPPSGAPEVER